MCSSSQSLNVTDFVCTHVIFSLEAVSTCTGNSGRTNGAGVLFSSYLEMKLYVAAVSTSALQVYSLSEIFNQIVLGLTTSSHIKYPFGFWF